MDEAHKPPEGGYRQTIFGFLGAGPRPYQLHVALPPKLVIPSTAA